MHAPDDYAAAFAAALQVAAINGVRGLLAAEVEDNPDVQAVCVVLGADGSFEVTALNGSGAPVGGYAF
ncbi:hypothetical protein BURK2_01412 [Burkholderiales bacterium]|nr:hypothetical protein BURK2_01412 [Burkholderiales bacterium]